MNRQYRGRIVDDKGELAVLVEDESCPFDGAILAIFDPATLPDGSSCGLVIEGELVLFYLNREHDGPKAAGLFPADLPSVETA